MSRFVCLELPCAFYLVIMGSLVLPGIAGASNWERFRGPQGSGISDDKNIPVKFSAKENVLWKAPLHGLGNSCPIVWENRVFLQMSSSDGTERSLVCFDTAHGKEVWKRSIPASKASIHPLNSLASSTPVTDGEAVYVAFWNGKSVLLSAYRCTGEPLWQRDLGSFISQHGSGASPILYKDMVILAHDMDREEFKSKKPVPNPSRLIAFNKKTGTTEWELPREAYRACYSAPFILEKKGHAPELIITSTTAITSYDPDTGKPNWNWKWEFTAKMPLRTVASTVYHEGILVACSGDGGGDRHTVAVALNGFGKEAHPDKLWENKKEFPYVPTPLIHGEYVYFVNDAGYAGCFHAASGQKVWYEREPDSKYNASPVLIDGKMYACSEQGDVVVFAAQPTFQRLARNSLGEGIRATPAVADGRLYIRTRDHLYCIGNPK